MKEVDSMKCNRRILSMLLAICLIVALIPATVSAETTEILPSEIQFQDIVSFGGKDWVVLDRNMNEMVLLLKTPEETIAYNLSGLTNAWDDSNAKAWCADFKATLPSAVSEVSFLTYDELLTYFANGSMDNLKATLADGTTKIGWWVRYDPEGSVSTGGDVFGIAVSDAGFVGVPHVATNYAARPVIRIPAQNIISAISDGSTTTLKVVEPSEFAGFNAQIAVSEDATVTYSGTKAGNVVAVLTDRAGNVLDTQSVAVADGASGTVTFDLDGKVGIYTVKVYNEAGLFASAITQHSFNIEDSHGEVAGYEATVKGDVSVNFAIDVKEEVASDPDAYVVVSTPSGSTTVKVSEMDDSSHEGANKSLLVSVKAPQMTDEITIQVHSSNGNGAEHTYTVREYVENVIKAAESVIADENKTENERNNAHKERNFARHMLNYGAKAQSYFNYNTNDLANKNIGVVTQNPVTGDGKKAAKDGDVAGINFVGSTLVMNNQTALRFYFKCDNIGDYSFVCNGVKLNPVVKRSNAYDGYVEVSDISPDKLNKNFTVEITLGNASASVSYSPMDHIRKQYTNTNDVLLKNMLQALFNYYEAAVDYLASLA